MRVLVLSGGRSAEHDISIVSACFVGDVLRWAGHETIMAHIGHDGGWSVGGRMLTISADEGIWRLCCGSERIEFDIVFPVLHGPFGEDGTVQGLCMMAGWAFAGAGVMTSSLAMNKSATKEMVSARGIPVLPWKTFHRSAPPGAGSIDDLGYPVFVKPARMGSSVGISRVDRPESLDEAVKTAFCYDSLLLIEQGIDRAREIEVALLSEDGRISSSVPGEIVPGLEWYDYSAKYHCPGSRLLIPAPVPDELASLMRTSAERVFSILAGSGYARVDFLLDRDGSFYFNEVNTIPGFTEISMFPKLWEAAGIGAGELIERIMMEALRSHAETASVSTEVNR